LIGEEAKKKTCPVDMSPVGCNCSDKEKKDFVRTNAYYSQTDPNLKERDGSVRPSGIAHGNRLYFDLRYSSIE
jgi:hypothetical protein